jgi:hypothetical protein
LTPSPTPSDLPSRLGDEEATLNEFVAAKAAPMAPSGTVGPASAAQAKVERAGAAFDRVVARETGAHRRGARMRRRSGGTRPGSGA